MQFGIPVGEGPRAWLCLCVGEPAAHDPHASLHPIPWDLGRYGVRSTGGSPGRPHQILPLPTGALNTAPCWDPLLHPTWTNHVLRPSQPSSPLGLLCQSVEPCAGPDLHAVVVIKQRGDLQPLALIATRIVSGAFCLLILPSHEPADGGSVPRLF